MLSTPSLATQDSTIIRSLHAKVLCQALPQPDHIRYRDDNRHHELSSTTPIRFPRRAPARRKEHAKRNKQISKHLRITRQSICHEYVSELAVLCFGQTAYAYTAKGVEEAVAATAGEHRDWEEETYDEDEEVEVREEIP